MIALSGPMGATPQALVLLDDVVFDAQCSADSQLTNTEHMLERFLEVFADGLVDDRDTEIVLDLYRHTRLEAHLNKEQASLMKWARYHTNKVAALVASYRARLQGATRAARRPGPQVDGGGG